MLKKSCFLGGLMVILLTMAGCQSEKYVDDVSSHAQQFTLTASKGVMSRTHLGSDGKQTLWSEGDEIFVSSADGKVTGILTLNNDDANKKSGTFGGLVDGDPSLLAYAVFPVPTNGEIDLSHVVGGNKLDAPMVGKIDMENKKVAFENTCGILRLNLQNASGKNFTVSAKNGENAVKLLTIAKVMVDNDGSPSLIYSASDNGTVSLENAVGGFMYIPYSIDEDVSIYVDKLKITTVEVATFRGKLKQKDVKTLTYSETTAGLIEPATAEIKDENVEGETLKVDVSKVTSEPGEDEGDSSAESHEFVNIPSITEALTGGEEGAEVTITEVVVELPKIEETSAATKSVVSFEEIPQGVTVTIQEEETENKSLEELTVILPSTETEEEAKEAIAINMPNTTVTVKSTDGKTLYIKNVTAETFDQTLVVDQNVEITSLTILKGGVQVFGKIGQLMRDASNQDEVTMVTIEVGGSIGQIVGEGFSVEDKNPAEEVKEDFVFNNKELSKALYGVLGAEKVSFNADSCAVMKQEDVLAVTSLDFSNKGYTITSLAGIENFVNLEELRSNSVGLVSCDLSKNKALKVLMLTGNKFKSLDLSSNVNLEVLYLEGCMMTSLKLDNCTKLGFVNLYYSNSLTSFDVPNKAALYYLDCRNTKLQLNLSEYTGLSTLKCSGMGLKELGLSTLTKIKTLWCDQNEIGTLDVTPLSNLMELRCGNQKNNIVLNLKLTDAQKEKWESEWKNNANNANVKLAGETAQNVTIKNKELAAVLQTVLGAENVKIDSYGYAIMTMEYVLSVRNLQLNDKSLRSLDGIAFFKNLEELNCENNALENLNLSELPKLKNLNCVSNKLHELDLSACSGMTNLRCAKNQLANIHVNHLVNLVELDIIENQLTSLNVSSLKNLRGLCCFKNHLPSLDLSGCPLLSVMQLGEQTDITGKDLVLKLKLADSLMESWTNKWASDGSNKNVVLDTTPSVDSGNGNTGADDFTIGGIY